MTDAELKDLVASLAVAQAEAAKAQTETSIEHQAMLKVVAETSRRVEETSRKLDEVGLRLGNMGQNLGAAAESFFYNSLDARPEIGGIQFDRVTPNMIAGSRAKRSEFDIVLTNGASVAIVEVKFRAHVNDLDQVEQQIIRYRELFPEHKNYAIYGGVAGQSVPADVLAAAKERGLFVLQQVGSVMSSATEGMRAH